MDKICKKCGIEKDISLFVKRSDSKSGYRDICKKCIKEYRKVKIEYNVIDNKKCNKCFDIKLIKEFNKRKDSPDGYRNDCKICQKEKTKKWRISQYRLCKKCNIETPYNDFAKNATICNICNEEYNFDYENTKNLYKISRIKSNSYKSIYYKTHKNKRNSINLRYFHKKYKNDILFRLKSTIRSVIYQSIKRSEYIKNSTSEFILGCSINEFKIYLESKFESWMTWENYGKYNGNFEYGWDIDHIEPLFPKGIIRTEEDILRLNHYTNLQPLCSHINRNIKKNLI
jgi:hypothetical protein